MHNNNYYYLQCVCVRGSLSAVCFPQCMNNGTCVNPGKCSCKQGFDGGRCELGKSQYYMEKRNFLKSV